MAAVAFGESAVVVSCSVSRLTGLVSASSAAFRCQAGTPSLFIHGEDPESRSPAGVTTSHDPDSRIVISEDSSLGDPKMY